jgi:hypothetical protein
MKRVALIPAALFASIMIAGVAAQAPADPPDVQGAFGDKRGNPHMD